MSNRFVSIPNVPINSQLSQQITVMIENIKENIELLTGLRDEVDAISKAVTQGQITVNVLGTQNMQQVSAKGNGFTHDGDTVASFDDYVKLITDVQTLANDLNYTRETLNVLIKQIKGN
jgi:hypothetical protein